LKKIVVSGERFFMKFGSSSFLHYFEERAKEADAVIVEARDGDDGFFASKAREASAVVVIGRKVGPEVIRGLEKCEIILALSVGYDCIDVAAATERGIPVCHLPAYCTDDVASHAMALLLTLTRKIPLFVSQLRKGRWDYNIGKPLYNYRGKILGIVGLGRIGRAVVPKAKGFGMEVSAYDPYLDDDIFDRLGVQRRYELDDLLRESDFITIHAPLTGETLRMIDARAIGLLKPHAVLVNTARGEILDEAALCEALREKRIGGAGLDVVDNEPFTPDNPLYSLDNAVVTPHVAWYSEESFRNSMAQSMDEVVGVLNGHRPRSIVNPQVLWKGRRG